MSTTTPPAGALKRITQAQIAHAIGLVGSARVFDLGRELNESIPQGGEASVPFRLSWRTTPELSGPHEFSMESVSGSFHTGTHIDGLAHVAGDGLLYGGEPTLSSRNDRGWLRYGMETVPPIVGRCVLADVAAIKGVSRLPDGYEITVDDLRAAGFGGQISLRSGDIVLIHTGKGEQFYSDPDAYLRSEPGIGSAAARWLYEHGMAVVGSDTTGTEPLPMPDPAHSVHRALIVDCGVHLLENLQLAELAAAGVREALFIALPLKITGGTGSWIRPIAIA